MRLIKFLFIHCTATPCGKDYSKTQILEWFAAKGWSKPGYHYIVHLDGNITQLLKVCHVANGVKGFNQNAIHIAYIGGLSAEGKPSDTRTDKQKETLAKLIKEVMSIYPYVKVKGHNEVANKACPCYNVKKEVYGR